MGPRTVRQETTQSTPVISDDHHLTNIDDSYSDKDENLRLTRAEQNVIQARVALMLCHIDGTSSPFGPDALSLGHYDPLKVELSVHYCSLILLSLLYSIPKSDLKQHPDFH